MSYYDFDSALARLRFLIQKEGQLSEKQVKEIGWRLPIVINEVDALKIKIDELLRYAEQALQKNTSEMENNGTQL